jgi:hypothetical protein
MIMYRYRLFYVEVMNATVSLLIQVKYRVPVYVNQWRSYWIIVIIIIKVW